LKKGTGTRTLKNENVSLENREDEDDFKMDP
jgi:hypothetical protein